MISAVLPYGARLTGKSKIFLIIIPHLWYKSRFESNGMAIELDWSNEALLRRIIEILEHTGRFRDLRHFTQHGNVSVYEHSIGVARTSLDVARRLPFRIDRASLVRGALLHDYFLYDWHVPEPSRPAHAFYHPRVALQNAHADYGLNKTEADIIYRHMFPLVPIPPRTVEGWIVCWVDTFCALRETVGVGRVRRLFRRSPKETASKE